MFWLVAAQHAECPTVAVDTGTHWIWIWEDWRRVPRKGQEMEACRCFPLHTL